MSDLRFPSSLRPVVSKGYSMTRRNNVWSVDLAGGGVRQGRDTYYDVFPISVTLITSALGRQAFLSFLEKVDGGASSFWMAHDFGMGIEDYQVTITSTIAESTEDGINWTITFTATAEKSPFQNLENQCLINNLPDLYGCYGDCLGSFLKIYANYETTFPRIWSNEGPAGHPPINLLASTLDSRIIYKGPQVYYIRRNGNLVQSGANEWPLTFIDGRAVGRVSPEDASRNLYINSETWGSAGGRTFVQNNAEVSPRGDITMAKVAATTPNVQHFTDDRVVGVQQGELYSYSIFVKAASDPLNLVLRVAIGAGANTIFNPVTGAFVANTGGDFVSKNVVRVSEDIYRVTMVFRASTTTGDSIIRVQLASGVDLTFMGTGENGIYVWGAQLEKSANTTSYIQTSDVTGDRTSASAKVVMRDATSIDITYSDDSVVNVPAVDGYATIPQADSAWGSKYITRIDFNVDG